MSNTVVGALVCGALACLVIAAFLTTIPLGLAALGASLGVLAYATRGVASRG